MTVARSAVSLFLQVRAAAAAAMTARARRRHGRLQGYFPLRPSARRPTRTEWTT
jgi:hypothetical protein